MRASPAPAFLFWSRPHLLWGLGTGALFTILLNVIHLLPALHGQLTVIHLLNHGRDEAYYAAVIRGLARGADIYHAATQAPLLQSWLLPAGAGLTGTLLAGDVLYPFLAVFFLFFAALGLLRSPRWAAASAMIAAASLGGYWLRTSNPQVPYVLVAAYAALYCSRDERRGMFLARGAVIGLLCHVQLLYGSFLLILEAVDAARRFFLDRERPLAVVRDTGIVLGATAVLCLPILWGVFLSADPAGGDIYRRLGVIPSRYPSAPQFQLQLLLAAGIFLIARARPKTERQVIDRVLVVIAAALLGFNQALLHGVDATFSSYYVNVLLLLRWLAFPVLAIAYLGRTRGTTAALAVAAVFMLLRFAGEMGTEAAEDARRIADYAGSQERSVIAVLPTATGAVAAPLVLADRIPVLTDRDALFTSYAYNWRMPDRELAERYLLQRALFPSSGDLTEKERGYPSVFGGYPGMLAARERTVCRYRARLLRRDDDCVIDPRTLVVHQELLAMLDNADADLPSLVKKFRVGLIVTDWILPSGLQDICTAEGTVGTYTVYGCSANDK